MIGKYIIDFVCLEKRLIIEVDGRQHLQQERDNAKRTQWLERQNFRVIRFWNNMIFEEMETVTQVIWDALYPPPFSSPARGEEHKEDDLLEKPTVPLHNERRGIPQRHLPLREKSNRLNLPPSRRKEMGASQVKPSPLAGEG